MFLSCKYAALAFPIRAFTSASDPPCSSMMLPKYVKVFTSSKSSPSIVIGSVHAVLYQRTLLFPLCIWRPTAAEADATLTHYAVHYKTVFKTAPIKQFRCCPGFTRQPGYEGCVPVSNCSRFLKESGTCQNGGLCYENATTIYCNCPKGFTGSRCQITSDCNELNNYCQNDCGQVPGSKNCRCPPGYFLAPDKRRCLDIDECKYDRGGCMYFCENLPGGYRCACPSDMVLAPDKISCIPFFNPCEHPPNGDCEHICTSLPGYRYMCSCKPGYHLAENKKRCLRKYYI
ncbi:unnamed protein product [Schistosoma margrebowiei]|uniref:Uncharacterized protein n=1 Tax=Schistosoma margrebowiei TaxID=48269 RepID=A0A183MM09_9TREM|nr:unnamed protein product [Schistosoma margrebowiei]